MALDYELGYLLEPRSAPPGWRPAGQPLARFWRFHECQPYRADEVEAWLASLPGAVAGVLDVRPAMTEKSYRAAVDRVQALITAGDCYQVNLTFPLEFSYFGSPLALYRRLRAGQPVRYGGFVGDGRQGFVSLSPELFIERQGDVLRTRPMKGTIARDVAIEDLRDSPKNRAENLMIVDLLRNDLGRIALNGSVRVDKLFDIEDYPTLRQMVSEISATVTGCRFADILPALFPCGSITGAPKIRAMQIIGELESTARGIYTGALGWMAPNGDFRLNVAIRTLQLAADQRGRMGIGSGLVADSQAGDEWQECLLKARFLSAGESGLRLIETLRREDGHYPRLAGHLARLRRSAASLGFALDEATVRAQLLALPAAGLERVRLTLGQGGDCQIAAFPLGEEPAGLRRAVMATALIDANHPLRRHKTTERAVYDQALAQLAADPAIFDAVFINQRGELAEGARSTIFVERDGVLLTPPLASGALPGVLRAELLASGRAREAVLWPSDLVGGFWLGNALRGLIAVSL